MLTLSQPKVEPLDASSLRDKLMVLTDGQGHYVTVDPEAPYGGNAFTGDGKMFAKIPVTGGGRNGSEQWSITLWDPRVQHGGNSPASVDMKDSGASYSAPWTS